MAASIKRPSKNRQDGLKRRYGMTEEQYNVILAAQEGKCAICGRYRKLSVDHSHKTGKVRGLLCAHCNSAIGFLEENTDIMERAIIYIINHKEAE